MTPLTMAGIGYSRLYKFCAATREEGRDYVVLPNQNFNAYFGATAFSQKGTAELIGK